MRFLLAFAVILPLFIYLGRGEPDRLVHFLESQGYKDIELEHPNQFHCVRHDHPFSYRARRPDGTMVHGGACVSFLFLIQTTEPIPNRR